MSELVDVDKLEARLSWSDECGRCGDDRETHESSFSMHAFKEPFPDATEIRELISEVRRLREALLPLAEAYDGERLNRDDLGRSDGKRAAQVLGLATGGS